MGRSESKAFRNSLNPISHLRIFVCRLPWRDLLPASRLALGFLFGLLLQTLAVAPIRAENVLVVEFGQTVAEGIQIVKILIVHQFLRDPFSAGPVCLTSHRQEKLRFIFRPD